MLSQTFRDLLESLNSRGVRHLIVGGYAVIYHGYTRHTKDIDIWVEPSEETAGAVAESLRECGFPVTPVMEMQMRSPRQLLIVGEAPNRIDILTGIQDFDFDEMYSSRKIDSFQGLKLSIVGLENLRKLKQAAGRLQDLLDLEKLPSI